MRCFKCSKEIVSETPAPVFQRWHYNPAFVVEVIGGGCKGDGEERCTVVCWHCLNEINPDMWMSDEGWDSLLPVVPFARLPICDHDVEGWDEVETYAFVEVK